MSELQIVGLIISALVSSGALAFFMRYNTRLCLVEKEVESNKNKTKALDDESRKAGMELFSINQNLAEMRLELKVNSVKLDAIGEIKAKLEFIIEGLKGTVTSKECELHMKDIGRKTIENDN